MSLVLGVFAGRLVRKVAPELSVDVAEELLLVGARVIVVFVAEIHLARCRWTSSVRVRATSRGLRDRGTPLSEKQE